MSAGLAHFIDKFRFSKKVDNLNKKIDEVKENMTRMVKSDDVSEIKSMAQSQFDALEKKDDKTIYITDK